MNKKEIKKYLFSVEGDTERWYLKWLESEINAYNECKYKVSFDVEVQKSPSKRVKKMRIVGKVELLHMFDYEEHSNESSFQNTLKDMKKAETLKNVQYKLGYCNFSFDLWIILHKHRLAGQLNHRREYLQYLNKYYDCKFESLQEYKEEKNFKKLLSKLSLHDVEVAMRHAYQILAKHKDIYKEIQYGNYMYYREHPSLNLHEYIHKIFRDVGLKVEVGN